MKLVVKIGGQAAEDPKGRRRLARQIVELRRAGHSVVVVHGGGKTLTRTLDRLGMATEFHQGLRVTDAATRDVALMVLAGIVNKQWVAEFAALGQPALGICGGDAGLVSAKKISLGSQRPEERPGLRRAASQNQDQRPRDGLAGRPYSRGCQPGPGVPGRIPEYQRR